MTHTHGKFAREFAHARFHTPRTRSIFDLPAARKLSV